MTTETANARLFIAVWPTLAVRRALAAQQRLWRWPVRGYTLMQSAAGRYAQVARYG